MRFENQFAVDAPLEEVWAAVLDVERVAPTVPGAQVLERTGEDSYKVAINVKVGPMSMTYRGEVEITERDDAAHRAVMKARAKESRGQGTANADVVMALSEEGGRTAAAITTDVALTGKVASMGQGVLQDVSGRLVQTFAGNLAAMLEGGGAAGAGEAPAPAAGAVGAPGAGEGAPEAVGEAASAPAEAPRLATEDGAGEGGGDQAASASSSPPAAADALDLGAVGGAVVADRLKSPRVVGSLLGIVAGIFFLLGRRSKRSA